MVQEIMVNPPPSFGITLFNVANICNEGITQFPRNSSRLSVWNSQWIYNTPPLRQCINGPLTQKDDNLTIRDIWLNNKWDLSQLSMIFPQTLINKVSAIKPSLNTCDTPIWAPNTNGLFTSKSCYNLVTSHSPTDKDFSWIWDLNCPNKLKYLV